MNANHDLMDWSQHRPKARMPTEDWDRIEIDNNKNKTKKRTRTCQA